MTRQVDDHLFPHWPAEVVLQIVDLVHDDDVGRCQALGLCIQHVAQDFGGHHHSGRIAIDGVISGEQPHLIWAQPRTKVPKLLI